MKNKKNRSLRVAILVPSLLMHKELYENQVFAPGHLAIDLANELVDLGHHPVLFSSQDTKSKAPVIAISKKLFLDEVRHRKASPSTFYQEYPKTAEGIDATTSRWLVSLAYQMAQRNEFDVIHNMYGFLSLYFAPLTSVPTIVTLHDSLFVGQRSRNLRYNYSSHPDANYVSISNFQRRGMPKLNYISTVYNGVNTNNFSFSDAPRDQLVWMGRVTRVKGLHTALRVAAASKTPLSFAGRKPTSGENFTYYKNEIQPLLGKAPHRTPGFISSEKDRAKFLGSGKALLFPVEWDEAFGLVMTEALSCGTPVIAFDRGSVREIVRNGVNGFVVKNEKEMVAAVKKIHLIDRRKCRASVERKFSNRSMAEGYAKVYQRLVK